MLINWICHTKSESDNFCIPENGFTKSPFEFVFLFCEFTKVIVWSKSWCEMFVLNLYGIQKCLCLSLKML